MTGIFWDNVLLFKGLYDQTLDPVAQRWNLTRMELDLLLFLHNNPTRNTAAEAVRLRRWTKSHVSAAIRDLKSNPGAGPCGPAVVLQRDSSGFYSGGASVPGEAV